MPLEYPVQTYIHSVKIRLTIRLDEFGNASRLAAAPPKTTKNLNGVKDLRAPLEPVQDPAAPAGFKRYLLLPKGQTAAQAATGYQQSSDGLTFDVTVVPQSMEVSLNGIRTANTMKASFRYIDLPIDPRLVRGCAVEAFLGTRSEADFVAGIEGRRRTEADLGVPLDVLEDTYVDAEGRQRTNSRFLGWVDDWKMSWTEDGEAMIDIECRDNTQLMIEQDMAHKLVLDMSKPIDEAVALYLSHYPQMQGLSVQYLPAGNPPPVLKKVLQKAAFRPQLGPPPSKAGGATHKMSVWDYLTDVMGSIGHIIRVDGTVVILQLPRTLMTKQAVRRFEDPFQGRTLATGEVFDYRRFIYGRNEQSLTMSRKFAKGAPANVEIRCFNGENKTLLVERFPLPADRAKFVIPGNAQPDQKWEVIRVYGINDKKTLKATAQSYYESQGRNELDVEIRTKNLASYGGGNDDPDILDMREGDTFEALVSRAEVDEAGSVNRLEGTMTTQQQNEVFMRDLGMSREFAAAYARAYVDAGFLTQFRLKELTLTWTADEGIDVTVHGVNYIEVRLDKTLGEDEPPADAFRSNVPPTRINSQ
jgi:hypothetical protein